MSKYSYEEKLEAVLRVIKDGMSAQTSAKINGTALVVVKRWVAQYEQLGSEGLTMKHGYYDGAFKVNVVKYMHKNHLSNFQTALKFGIPSDSTVGRWECIYYEKGPHGLHEEKHGRRSKMNSNRFKKKNIDKATKKDLLEEIIHLRMENEY
ncbi:transposase [Clostridium perfringens]|nr:transposase [Clostridium perfringens]